MPASPGPTQPRSARWLIACLLCLLASASVVGSARAAAPTVEVRRDGDSYVVRASGSVAADPRIAWDALTDYDHLGDFVPDIERSRVVSRAGNRLIVEHVGAFRLLFVSMPVRVRLAVEQEPYRLVVARTEPGKVGADEQTLSSVASQYRLTPLPEGGVRVDYDARFQLGEMLPDVVDSMFGKSLVEHGLRRHFAAMLDEIERRQNVLASTPDRR